MKFVSMLDLATVLQKFCEINLIPTVITEINLQTSKETFETENLSPHQIQEKSRSSKGCLLLLTRSGDATTARYAHEPAGRRATRRATRRVRPRGRERSKRRRRGNDPNPRWKRLSPQTSQRPHHHTPLTFSASFLASPLRSPLAESIHQIEEKKLQTSNRLLGLSASLFSFFFLSEKEVVVINVTFSSYFIFT